MKKYYNISIIILFNFNYFSDLQFNSLIYSYSFSIDQNFKIRYKFISMERIKIDCHYTHKQINKPMRTRNRIFIRNFSFIFTERGCMPVWIKWNLSIYVHSSPFVVTCRFLFSFHSSPPLSVIHKSLCDNRNLDETRPSLSCTFMLSIDQYLFQGMCLTLAALCT